jgi:hypothetical protein
VDVVLLTAERAADTTGATDPTEVVDESAESWKTNPAVGELT